MSVLEGSSRRRRLLVCLLMIVFGFLLVGEALAESRPSGYGYEPCATLAYDLATSRGAAREVDWDYRMNLISCEQRADGTWEFRASKYDRGCGKLAYESARALLQRGYGTRLWVPSVIGHEIDRRDHARDCTLYEDWSWG